MAQVVVYIFIPPYVYTACVGKDFFYDFFIRNVLLEIHFAKRFLLKKLGNHLHNIEGVFSEKNSSTKVL
jgi:hypothetical protein